MEPPTVWPRLLELPQAVLRRLHADGRKIVVITNESTDRFKKSEAIEKAILKKTGRLMGFAKAHSCLQALCSALQRSARTLLHALHALCMRSARTLLALCTLSAPGPRRRACRCLCCAPRPRTASASRPQARGTTWRRRPTAVYGRS